MESFRDSVENALVRLANVRPITERDCRHIDDFKDGSFGISFLGLLLYCNGCNPRGVSSRFPNGLLYFDKENFFGISVFRRERDAGKGHLFVVAPRGLNAVGAVEKFLADAVEAAPQLAGQFAFVRFLNLAQYKEFLQKCFLPVQEEPWSATAFAEDETFGNSVVELNQNFRGLRGDVQRFQNFLQREKISLSIGERFDSSLAKQVVEKHFALLEAAKKRVGSVAQDYFNVLDSPKKDFSRVVFAVRGNKRFPIGVFVGEKLSEKRLALYCNICAREEKEWVAALGLPSEKLRGFSALGSFVLLKIFEEIEKQFPEVTEVHLGGSETADLNSFKARLGAANAPSYWVAKRL